MTGIDKKVVKILTPFFNLRNGYLVKFNLHEYQEKGLDIISRGAMEMCKSSAFEIQPSIIMESLDLKPTHILHLDSKY